MIGANADPTYVLPQIVNSIGHVFLLSEIMYLDRFRLWAARAMGRVKRLPEPRIEY